jgi:hypothetical protein
MKKRFAILTAACMIMATSSYALKTVNPVPQSVMSEFSHHFYQAQNVKWEKIDNYYEVTFNQSGRTLFAFYSEDKDFMGIANYVNPTSLPVSLLSDVKKNYGNYWISDLFKYSVNEEAGYFITIENADQTIMLKSDMSQKWHLYKVTKK